MQYPTARWVEVMWCEIELKVVPLCRSMQKLMSGRNRGFLNPFLRTCIFLLTWQTMFHKLRDCIFNMLSIPYKTTITVCHMCIRLRGKCVVLFQATKTLSMFLHPSPWRIIPSFIRVTRWEWYEAQHNKDHFHIAHFRFMTLLCH